jgi:hypothetical protein
VVAYEVADGVVPAKVAPTEYPTDEPESPRMPPSELDAHRERLVVGQEAVVRNEPLATNAHLAGRAGTEVVHPVGVRAPA